MEQTNNTLQLSFFQLCIPGKWNILLFACLFLQNTATAAINCPADVMVACGMPTDPAATGMATVTDVCDDASITFSDNFQAACGATSGTILRTWLVISEDCDEQEECVQTITIFDLTPPTINCPPAMTVECGMPTDLAATGLATGGDDCSLVSITYTDEFEMGCSMNSGVITRYFVATNECSLSNRCNQTITIEDNTPPVITGPLPDGATMNVECNLRDPDWTPFLITTDDLTISDNCSARPDITVNFEDIILEEGECGVSDFLSFWRCIWIATDECGNTSSYTLFLRIEDTNGPAFTFFPADEEIECYEEVPFQQATAEDDCSEVELTYLDSRINDDCPNNYTILRRWTAEDGCGNKTVDDQLIHVSDTHPPTLTFTDEYVSEYTDGQDIFTDCFEYGNITNLAYAVTANDICSGATEVNFAYEDFGLFDCAEDGYSGHLQTRWTSTDECGNSATVTLNWFLLDQTAPILQGVPEDECVTALPPAPNVQAVDECEFADLAYVQSAPIDCNGGQYVERTWTATDVCGNTTSATQRITITDGLGLGPVVNVDYPELSGLPSGSTAQMPTECNPDGTWWEPDFAAAVVLSEGCGVVDLQTDLQLLNSGNCTTTGYIARYRFAVTAIDLCENRTDYELFIEMIDASAPIISSPTELVLACGEAIPDLIAEDVCNAVASIIFVDPQPIVASCPDDPQSNNRFWIVTDDCDNSVVFAQSITIIDAEGPVLSNIPADACNDLEIIQPVRAFDECTGTNIPVELSEVTTNETSCGEILTRTWTATDACGNTSVATQQVFFTDDTPPALTFAHPLLVGLENGEELRLPIGDNFGSPNEIYDFGEDAIAISDNCASDLEAVLSILFLDEVEDCVTSGYHSRILLTWTVTDPCGNSAKKSMILVYEDTYAPELFLVPDHLSLYCTDHVPAAPMVDVKDNFDDDVELIFSEESIITPLGLRIIRRWTATDDCGNTTVEEQYIDIFDNSLDFAFEVPNVILCNTDNNEISVLVSGGTVPYTYRWEMTDCDGFLTSDPTLATVSYTVGYTAQNFSVTITDVEGCERVVTTVVLCEKPDEGNTILTGHEYVDFGIYPNPVDHELVVQAGGLTDQAVTLRVYSLLGQEMLRKDLRSWPEEGCQVNTAGLPNGTYIIRLDTDGIEPLIKEVVVIH